MTASAPYYGGSLQLQGGLFVGQLTEVQLGSKALLSDDLTLSSDALLADDPTICPDNLFHVAACQTNWSEAPKEGEYRISEGRSHTIYMTETVFSDMTTI
jgi:hypothetical protein